MIRNYGLFTFVAVTAACLVLLTVNRAEAEKKTATLADEEVCIPKAVEKKVLSCPEDIDLAKGKLGGAVGTSKAKKEKKK